jgi:hypothetical protein
MRFVSEVLAKEMRKMGGWLWLAMGVFGFVAFGVALYHAQQISAHRRHSRARNRQLNAATHSLYTEVEEERLDRTS